MEGKEVGKYIRPIAIITLALRVFVLLQTKVAVNGVFLVLFTGNHLPSLAAATNYYTAYCLLAYLLLTNCNRLAPEVLDCFLMNTLINIMFKC